MEEAETVQPVKIHFASGKVNGYFDSTRHTEDDWYRLTNAATNKHFDVLGRYAHLTFETQHFRNTTKELIDLYDDIVYEEMKFKDIAKIMGCSVSTTKSRFRLGINQLKKLMENDYEK